MSWPKFSAIILRKFMSGTRLGVAPTNVQSRIAGRLARMGQFVGKVLFDQSRARHKFIYIYCVEVLLPWDPISGPKVLVKFMSEARAVLGQKPCALRVQGESCPECNNSSQSYVREAGCLIVAHLFFVGLPFHLELK